MGWLLESPPEGGETIYEIVRVRDWLRAKFYFIAKGLLNVSMCELQEEDLDLFEEYFEAWMKRAYAFLDGGGFWEGIPGRLQMAYGIWVERELRLAIVNRLSVVKQHPAWNNLGTEDRLKLACVVIFKTCVRCGMIRGYAFDEEVRGKVLRPEPPMSFVDSFNAKHVFNLRELSPVQTFCPDMDFYK